MKNLSTLLAFCFLFCSCSEVPKHIELTHQVGLEFSKEVYTSKNLVLVCTGGELMDDIQKICLTYAAVRPCSIPEARCLLVSLVENFLEIINTNEQIRPYLHEFPFTNKNIEMAVRFVDRKGNYLKEPYVSYAYAVNGRISYTIYDTRTESLEILQREFYDEAVSKVTRCEEGFSK